MTISWQSRYALRTRGITSSTIRELLKLTQRPDVISFAGGLPAAEYFPVERFQEACQRVLAEQSHQALQYGPTEGYVPLREFIASRFGCEAITADNILITSGSQQALSLLGALLIDPGDCVLVEQPTYLGALQAFAVYEAQYIDVETDEHGICTDALPDALRQNPTFMYLIPNFQNPSGVTTSEKRRREVLELAHRHGVPIVEDDPYGALRYESETIKPIITMDAEEVGCSDASAGTVIYLGTFSKTLAPGLRIAWVAAPREVIAKLVQLKQGADLHTSTFNQMIIYEVAKDGFIDEHVELLRNVYRKRRDAMLGALDRFMPSDVDWTHPDGGLFLWMQLPKGTTSQTVFEAAVKRNVAFVPGDSFYVKPNPPATARLNFSCMNEESIIEGIRRLGEAIQEVQNNPIPTRS
jgi:2-aminoadipate transaminase